ncbi:hypothetical protein I215_01963 [Galbibacter marinus]|uniref:Phage protein n=1 Tax=Galbibacter marinus TaxID=555500 RepID=K2PXW5_9FLAO|nr:hypothetical protein [Galbibacter marinus]EKF56249.1 hypothetical protein I215_01963 [Galbibacter marinus]
MRLGENNRNLTELEKKAGQKASRTLRNDLRKVLKASIVSQTGEMVKKVGTGVRMKYDALDAIVIRATKATFIQHYGFEGIKKNRVAMNLKAYGHFDNLFDKTNALETLATEVAELRGEEVETNITNIISVTNGRQSNN